MRKAQVLVCIEMCKERYCGQKQWSNRVLSKGRVADNQKTANSGIQWVGWLGMAYKDDFRPSTLLMRVSWWDDCDFSDVRWRINWVAIGEERVKTFKAHDMRCNRLCRAASVIQRAVNESISIDCAARDGTQLARTALLHAVGQGFCCE